MRDKVVLCITYKTEPWLSRGWLYFPFCLYSSLASKIVPSLRLNTQASLHKGREKEDKVKRKKGMEEVKEGGRGKERGREEKREGNVLYSMVTVPRR